MAIAAADHPSPERPPQNPATEHFGVGLARALAGSLIFSIPLLMTMEMWWLGFTVDRWRLALLTLVTVFLLIGLAFYQGFEENISRFDKVVDAFVGYAVGIFTAVLLLYLFGAITFDMPFDEILGKVALEATGGSIGALLARSQLGGTDRNGAQGRADSGEEQNKPESADSLDPEAQSYWTKLFIMIVGALVLAYNIAPTNETILIAYQITPWHAVILVLLSLIIIQSFVYHINFYGQAQPPARLGFWDIFLRYSVVGYICVLLVSYYILWTFGSTDGSAFTMTLHSVIVLGLPGSLGAAAARLIL